MRGIAIIYVLLVWSAGAQVVTMRGTSAILRASGSAGASVDTADQGRVEMWLDDGGIVSIAGLSRSINTPTKYAGNPVMSDSGNAWDAAPGGGTIRKRSESDYIMWYSTFAAGFHTVTNYVAATCIAVSSNCVDWTRPNLGITNYGGHSTNNIIVVNFASPPDANTPVVITDADGQYVMLGFAGDLHTSTDATNWTDAGSAIPAGRTYADWGPTALLAMSDGRFRHYTQLFTNSLRHGAMATATNYDAAWTHYNGSLQNLEASAATDQVYWTRVQEFGGNYLGYVTRYNNTTQKADVHLYFARDGVKWHRIASSWVPRGGAGTWDVNGIYGGPSMIRVGNSWLYYYSGTETLHNSQTFVKGLGYASIGYRRIGQIASTGTVRCAKVVARGPLTINANATGGSLTAALISSSTGAALSGYGHGDCATITNDVYAHEVMWGSKATPIGARVEVEFTLSNATLYSYSMGEPDSATIAQGVE